MQNTGTVLESRISGNRSSDLIVQPVAGDYKWSARSSDFNGWLVCDGRSLQKEAYPDLYTVIGTSFGSDNGSTFNLPDCRGRTPCGVGQGPTRNGIPLSNRILGQYLGKETHQLSIAEMPSHTHDGTTSTNGAHNHGGQTGAAGFGTGSANPATSLTTMDVADDNGNHTHSISTDGAHNHTFTTQSTGGDVPHENMQPSVFLGNVFIYSARIPAGLVNLDAVREWAISEETGIAFTDAFPDSYLYVYDASNYDVTGYTMGIKFNISDGGGDMFDGGNYISIGGDVFGVNELPNAVAAGSDKAVPYGTLYDKPDLTGGIYISSTGVYPHLVMTYTVSGTLLIRVYGNTGSDSDAIVTNFDGVYTCDNGRTGQYWANINFAAEDHTIGDVWFTITKPEWNSTITNFVDNRKETDTNNYNQSMSVTGTNYMFCKVLLSRVAGAEITLDLVERFLSAYVQSMPDAMGFNFNITESPPE